MDAFVQSKKTCWEINSSPFPHLLNLQCQSLSVKVALQCQETKPFVPYVKDQEQIQVCPLLLLLLFSFTSYCFLAVSASGYAFCYPCIFRHVQQHQRCPITLIPMSVEQIRKIYEA
jgi:hypothetical protein